MARTVQDLKKGDEILIAYDHPFKSLKEREEKFTNLYGFQCRCELCEWQRNDPSDKLRERLLNQCNELYDREKSAQRILSGISDIINQVRY